MHIACLIIIVFGVYQSHAQQTIYFGIIKDKQGSHQARYEAERDGAFKKISFAPYGSAPVMFENLVDSKTNITFTWRIASSLYSCDLANLSTSGFVAYEGRCVSSGDTLYVLLRDFTGDDAALQGNNLQPSMGDVKIIERAEELLNNGKNWRRNDNRVCDSGEHPDQWTLFCALHQASIEIAAEYRHLRPAIKAVRNSIQALNPSKKYAHLLQDFNNETEDYNTIALALHQARKVLLNDMEKKK